MVRALVAIGKLPDTHLWAQGGVQDGLAAMRRAEEVYKSGNAQRGLAEVRKYNEADVHVLVDIVRYLLKTMIWMGQAEIWNMVYGVWNQQKHVCHEMSFVMNYELDEKIRKKSYFTQQHIIIHGACACACAFFGGGNIFVF